MDEPRAQGPLDTRDARASISGDLSEVALVDLVQTLEVGRRTGTLRLSDRTGRSATVWLRDGRIVDCQLGAATGEGAFHRLLRWAEGEFAVEFEAVTRPARITAPNQALLLEGLRRADDWRRAAGQLPDLGAAVEIDYRLLSERLAEIPDDVNAVLRLIDGRRRLGDVIEEAGAGGDDVAVAAIMARLFVEEIVRLAPRRAAPPPPATPEPERVTWFAGPSSTAPAAPASGAPEAPPRIVRFPPRERPSAPTPRPGAERTVEVAEGGSAPAPAPAGVAERPPRPARRGLALLALVALVASGGGLAAWARWRGGDAEEYEARLGAARRERAAGRLASAIDGYRRALAVRDTSAGQAELGGALLDAAQPAAALEALRRAVELDATNAPAYMALGEVSLGEGRVDDARRAFERYLALEPQGDRAAEVRAALERMK